MDKLPVSEGNRESKLQVKEELVKLICSKLKANAGSLVRDFSGNSSDRPKACKVEFLPIEEIRNEEIKIQW